MKIYEYPDRKDWPAIVGRQKTGAPRQVKDIVSGILSDIREYGDAKVLEYVKRLDGFDTDTAGLRVPAEEIAAAFMGGDISEGSVKAAGFSITPKMVIEF